MKRYTVIVGNIVDGIELHGLYSSQSHAVDAAQDRFAGDTRIIGEIIPDPIEDDA